MVTHLKSLRRGIALAVFAAALFAAPPSAANGQELTLANDAFPNPLPDEPPPGGYTVAVQAGFVSGEKAMAIFSIPAAYRPCKVKRVQIWWGSMNGLTGATRQDSIEVWRGSVLNTSTTPAMIFSSVDAEPDGWSPQLVDGYLNEFDLSQFNIVVPSTHTQFGVALLFGTDPSPSNGPSVACDQPPPIPGCISGRNAIYGTLPPFITSNSWFNPCTFGMSGDFFIRAVIEKHVVAPITCPIDIADDQGTPLSDPNRDPGVPNGGVNEGDYNAFFMGFFDARAYCDFADDQGTALNDPNRNQSVPNGGVNEGDYNCFFAKFFSPCP